MKKKTLLAGLGALALAALLLGLYGTFAPRGAEGAKTVTISVAYPDGTRDEYTVETGAAYLKEAAETVLTLEGEETAYGFTLSAINGVEADFTAGNAYWAIYVNGEYGQYNLADQPVTDGDLFLFAYETY